MFLPNAPHFTSNARHSGKIKMDKFLIFLEEHSSNLHLGLENDNDANIPNRLAAFSKHESLFNKID